MIILIEEMGTRNSSATTCDNEVRMFWPTSTLPVKTLTVPSSPICIHAPTWLVETDEGSGGKVSPANENISCNTKATARPPPNNLKNFLRSSSKRGVGLEGSSSGVGLKGCRE